MSDRNLELVLKIIDKLTTKLTDERYDDKEKQRSRACIERIAEALTSLVVGKSNKAGESE